jgi:disulfide bond formation protein DsbB
MLDTVFLNKLRRVFAMVVTLAVLVVAFFVPGLLAKALVAAVIGAFFGLTHAVMIRLMMELTAIKSVLAEKVME